MALGLTTEHLDLAAAVRGWSQRHCPPDVVRAAAESSDGGASRYRAQLAPRLAEQGLFGLHLPEDCGGQGFGLPELAVALEELGNALLPGAFLATVLASAVLADVTDQADRSGSGGGAGADSMAGKLLVRLADGSVTGTVSLASGLTGTSGPDGALIVTGDSGPVLAGPMADLIIASVNTQGGEVWVVLEAADLDVATVDALDLTRPLARLRADAVPVPADRVLDGLDRDSVTSLAAILFGAEACGVANWAVQTAAEYAKIRHQFGRPIGQFQAVKHRSARMLTGAEQAAAAVWDAARTPAGPDREFAGAVAAVVALDVAVDAVNDCIQTLGGIGYTWEHAAHLYYRRALSVRALLGPSAQWRERVAALALDGAIEPLGASGSARVGPAAARPLGASGSARVGPAAARPLGVELPECDATFRAGVRAELAEIGQLTGKERTERLASGGWVLPHLPGPWGRGATPLEQLVIEAEMRAANIRPPDLAIGAWVGPALIQYGTPEQQRRFLPGTLRMDYLWCQLFSEPGAGSDLAGLSTRAERGDGGWRITGQKIWTSLARQAAWGICIARTDPSAPKHDGISYFLVDMASPGIEIRPLRQITGEASFNEVFLDKVFVPDDCLVGEINQGWRVARTTLANERVSLSQSWTFGSGMTELLAVARAADRPPLADIGRLVCEGRSIDLLGLRVTLKRVSGTEPGATGSVRKLLGMGHAQQIAELCFALSGDSGAVAAGFGSPVGRDGHPNGAHWARQTLAVRAATIGGGTTDIQLNIIAERLLGLPRDPGMPPS
jgi:alkylation response protein AidB-like acyl-CoA dehydrogenase